MKEKKDLDIAGKAQKEVLMNLYPIQRDKKLGLNKYKHLFVIKIQI